VRFLASEGISQFIDIGSGLPAAGPLHETAWQVNPDARIAYVDHDPVAAAHARALLGSLPPERAGQVAALEADLRYPRVLMTSRQVRDVIDLSRPAAVILSAVLHFIPDDADPAGILAAITARLAPGSVLAISHGTADFVTPDAELAARAAYAGASAPAVPRTGSQVAALLVGLHLIDPGITDIRDWRPDPGPRTPGPLILYAAAARIPAPGDTP
jgi:SAM-dependent methyltransferase